jgi:hypothetical protein
MGPPYRIALSAYGRAGPASHTVRLAGAGAFGIRDSSRQVRISATSAGSSSIRARVSSRRMRAMLSASMMTLPGFVTARKDLGLQSVLLLSENCIPGGHGS